MTKRKAPVGELRPLGRPRKTVPSNDNAAPVNDTTVDSPGQITRVTKEIVKGTTET